MTIKSTCPNIYSLKMTEYFLNFFEILGEVNMLSSFLILLVDEDFPFVWFIENCIL